MQQNLRTVLSCLRRFNNFSVKFLSLTRHVLRVKLRVVSFVAVAAIHRSKVCQMY